MLGSSRTLTGTHFHALAEIDHQNGQAETESEPREIFFDKIFDFCEHKFPLRYLGVPGAQKFFEGLWYFGVFREIPFAWTGGGLKSIQKYLRIFENI